MASIVITVLAGSVGMAWEKKASIGGYYAIRIPGVHDPLPDRVFDNPGVDGVYLRYYWRDLEPSQGNFQWTDLDYDLARALAAGKKFSIGIHTGGYSPSWLYARGTGIRKIKWSEMRGRSTGCTDFTGPVPYDAPYADRYVELLRALKKHLVDSGAYNLLTMVKVTPFNDFTQELHLPSTPYKPGSCESDAQSAWLALGYRPSLVLTAFKNIYRPMANIFPSAIFSFNVIPFDSFPGISEDGQKVQRTNDMAEAIIGYALQKTPGQVTVEGTALSNVQNTPQLVLWAVDQGAVQGWQSNERQQLHRAGCPDSLCDSVGYTELVQNGILSGAPYIEVWPRDARRFSGILVENPVGQIGN